MLHLKLEQKVLVCHALSNLSVSCNLLLTRFLQDVIQITLHCTLAKKMYATRESSLTSF